MTKCIIAAVAGAVMCAFSSHATTTFSDSSVLSSGKWVKIKVGETGVYEITAEQLNEFGFSNPDDVKVFGLGGFQPKETFNTEKDDDDLQQVPTLRKDGKIYFYARGLAYEQTKLQDAAKFDVYNTITINPYTAECYYFLTDRSDIEAAEVQSVESTDEAIAGITEWNDNGVVTWWHKKEQVNLARSGKLFLGEDFSSSQSYEITVPTPGIISGSSIMAFASVATKGSDSSLSMAINKTTVDTKNINETTEATIYKLLEPKGTYTARSTDASSGSVKMKLSVSNAVTTARVDYLTLSYKTLLEIPADSAQMRYIVKTSSTSGLSISNATATTQAWLVKTPSFNPYVRCDAQSYTINNGKIVPDLGSASYAEYVLFDTDKTQKHVSFVENVANQNLHALEAPDMLIITTAKLKNQAERLAQYHRDNDGMTVEVIDQNEIFNEFSSGMRSALAYRSICQMFYYRNAKKFAYLLLFGTGTYDNRCILGGNTDDMLLTYQSDNSAHTVTSYSTDDFFGIMSDGVTNVENSNAMISISIGRLPYASESDAKTYVDKAIKYMSHKTDKNDTWKSNMLVIGEYGDYYIHTQQTESFIKNFNTQTSTNSQTAEETSADTDYAMNINKIYLEPYDNVDNLDATRAKFVEDLNVGQNFVLFIGHSNPTSLTKPMVLMNLQQAIDTKYSVWPVMYFSSCDIGRYDAGISTILDKLMLNTEGGMIGTIAANREAYTSLNGYMTDAYGKFLGMDESNSLYFGAYPKTWARVLMLAKNNCTDRSRNRLKYHFFGDPAMRIDLPHNRTEITAIDGTEVAETTTVGAQKPIALTGRVVNREGNTDTSFNGYARLALYDSEHFYMVQDADTLTERGRELITASANVVNGEFSTTIVVPQCTTTDDKEKPLQITAVSDEGTVVSGYYHGLRFDRSLSAETTDETAPVISRFYIDDASTFVDGMTVDGSDVRLRADVSDNSALNFSQEQINTSAYISIDGGEQTFPVYSYLLDGIDNCAIDQTVYNLKSGRHTAQLVVSDLNGNTASRTIAFFIGSSADGTLEASTTAVTDAVTFSVDNADTTADTEMLITDSLGNVVLRTATAFPYTWDGTDSKGARVAEGVYNATAIIGGNSLPAKKIVVVKQ